MMDRINGYNKPVNILNFDGNKHCLLIEGKAASRYVTRIRIDIEAESLMPTLTVETYKNGVSATYTMDITGLNISGFISDECNICEELQNENH